MLSQNYFICLVISTPLKNISQIGSSFQLLGKIKIMFQTNNQSSSSFPVKYHLQATTIAGLIHLQKTSARSLKNIKGKRSLW